MAKQCPYCGEACTHDYGTTVAFSCGTIVRTDASDTRGRECLETENAALREQLSKAKALAERYKQGYLKADHDGREAVERTWREAMQEAAEIASIDPWVQSKIRSRAQQGGKGGE